MTTAVDHVPQSSYRRASPFNSRGRYFSDEPAAAPTPKPDSPAVQPRVPARLPPVAGPDCDPKPLLFGPGSNQPTMTPRPKAATILTASPALAAVPKPSSLASDVDPAVLAVLDSVVVVVTVTVTVCVNCYAGASVDLEDMLKKCESALPAVSPWKKMLSTVRFEKVRVFAVATTQWLLVRFTALSK
ncbi:hypothetical protein N657DRAFT_56147 [Parathielavia appendiculata]|uniref:Uncharacterized protein n=1 Tax=Parathielavia appendiculata TaxID=2587402 RepID=A0AAN6Z8N6_9PEZI|nr:hypothetical protein N657DRAFT_56147 [Parathielavia appendiculata]